jgi:hypothetical protein
MLVLLAAFGVIEQEEDGQGHGCIDGGTKKLVKPLNVKVSVAEETVIDEKDQETVQDEEAEVDEDTGRKVLYVDLNADTGGYVANDGFSHSIDADEGVAEGVLKQADCGAGKSAGDGIAAGDGEEDGNDERKIENGKLGKGFGEEGLQEYRAQRHQNRDGGREAVLLEFSTGCIAASGH